MTTPRRPRFPKRAVDELPDARDGLTRTERVILHTLAELEVERGGGSVPTAMLYGRLCDRIDIGVDELQEILARLGARRS